MTTDVRYNPVTVANRTEKIAADIRRVERRIEDDVYDAEIGYRPATAEQKATRAAHYTPQLDELRNQLAYWAAWAADGNLAGLLRERGDAVGARAELSLAADTFSELEDPPHAADARQRLTAIRAQAVVWPPSPESAGKAGCLP